MKWVLILFLAAPSGGASMTTVDMPDEGMCSTARVRIMQERLSTDREERPVLFSVCVQRSGD